MKLIDSKAELLTQEDGLQGIYKQIELAGRTCYKSEDKITDSSSVDFVKRMTQSGHTAMLEHGTVYLKMYHEGLFAQIEPKHTGRDYFENPYSKCVEKYDLESLEHGSAGYYITTNLRVLQENGWLDDLKYLCEPTEFHERRISLKFTTDRGVSHELVRHRVFSFAQESTRYCNYSKNKFGEEITYIIPSWLSDLQEGSYQRTYDLDGSWKSTTFGYVGAPEAFLDSINRAEHYYMSLLSMGHTPQEARQVLPNALKTEIVMTGFVSDWKHFFDLRLLGTTGKPHPDMLQLTTKAKTVLEEAGLWYLIHKEN